MTFKPTLLALTIATLSSSAFAGKLEVLHWWTSGSEAKSVGALKQQLEEKGHTWEDFAVAGGGGENAMTVLKSRVISGNSPSAAQIKGPEIQEWADQGLLTELTELATENNWDELLPQRLAEGLKYENNYVAVPVNVHRINWIWGNAKLLNEHNITLPKTWDEFFTTAEALKAEGITPLAYGGQPWQDATVFETMVIGMKGPAFYEQALIKLNPDALHSQDMIDVLNNYRRIKAYIDPNFSGRDWNVASNMLVNGEAAMQIMGDWAKGEFSAANAQAGQDILCAPSPGSENSFLYNVDSFVMFDKKDEGDKQAQADMANAILSPEFQKIFNLNKGSIPVRSDVDTSDFDLCAQDSAKLFVKAAENHSLLPSMAHSMAVSAGAQGAIFDVVTNFFNDDSISAEEAAKRLANSVQAAQ